MAALITITASLEASRLKYQPDSKYRLKRVAVTTATDIYDGTEAGKAEYQIKRARVGDRPGPNERMFTAYLDASHHQHEQEIASLKQAHDHQKQNEVANLKSECELRISFSDQARQQEIDGVKKQDKEEIDRAKKECEEHRLAADEETARVKKECDDRVHELCRTAKENHDRMMKEQEKTVQAQAEEIKSLKNQISQLHQGNQQLQAQNQCLAQTVASRDTDILSKTENLNDVSQMLAELQAKCFGHEQNEKERAREIHQYADENIRLEEDNYRLAQENSQLAQENAQLDNQVTSLMEELESELGDNAKAIADNIAAEDHIEMLRSNEEQLNKSLQASQKALKAQKLEFITLKADAESGVYDAANMMQKSNLEAKESRRQMPSEKRKEEKMKTARTKSGSAAPKGIQKTRGNNKKTLKKAIVNDSEDEDEDPASLVDRFADGANDGAFESFEYASREGRGLDALFGVITPPQSADSSMVE